MTKFPELFLALSADFAQGEIKVRDISGRKETYITARTVMNRLDTVLGPENWWDVYIPNEKSVACSLTIRLPDDSTLTKSDAGGYAGMSDAGDDDKSGFSDGLKRAAVKFGVARYLYRDGMPNYRLDYAKPTVAIDRSPAPNTNGHANANANGNGNGRHAAPSPDPALGGVPKSGRMMFSWVKNQEQLRQVGLLKYLNEWAKLQDFPGRMVDWNADEVALGHQEAIRKLNSLRGGVAEGGRR
jgi:hypothetical protein